jgi:hypothetical protein
MDARWEFDTMGLLLDNAFLPLLGMALVMHGRQLVIGQQALIAFRVLLVLCFFLAALFALLIPAAASDAQRLVYLQDNEFAASGAARANREEKIFKMVDGAKTMQELKAMGAALNLAPTLEQSRLLHLDENFDAFKKWTQNQVRAGLAEQQKRVEEQHRQIIAGLQKGCLRLLAGNILVAFCYVALAFKNLGLFRAHVVESVSRL